MRILVTGGAGFIGSHLVDALVEQGHAVTVLDNLSSGRRELVHPRAVFTQGDINDFPMVERFLHGTGPEVIFHLAAQINVRASVADPVSDAQTNILASLHLIQKAQENGVKKIIFSSTGGALYGETKNIPTPESEKLDPLSPYGVAKLSVEKYLFTFLKNFGLPYTVLRYANVYGPRQNAQGEAGVVAIFLNRMCQGLPPVIFGDGFQTRDYVFVGDVVRANLLALGRLEVVGTYNIGTGLESDLHTLFRELNTFFDGKFSPVFAPAKKADLARSALSAEKAKRELEWVPQVTLAQGLRTTATSFLEEEK